MHVRGQLFINLSTVLFLALLIAHGYAEEVPDLKGNFSLRTGAYEVEISATYAFTIRKILFEDDLLGKPAGFYGTIFAPASGKYIGSGHTEGGVEEVESIRLQVDGKDVSIERDGCYEGQSLILTKVSKLANLRLKVVMDFSPERLAIHKSYEALGDQEAFSLYLYQFSWTPDTREWIAELPNGDLRQGEFLDDKGWRLQQDVRWTGVYEPGIQKGMVMYYPRVIPGQQRKSAYWDVAGTYHKYYLMKKIPRLIRKGEKSERHTILLKGFSAKPKEWKEKVRQIANSLKAKEPREKVVSSPKIKNKVDIPHVGDISKEDWMVNRRGIEALDDDFVLPPFPPVKASRSGKIDVWGRRYYLDRSGLISQVDIKGKPFFQTPMDFTVEISGKKVDFKGEMQTLMRNPKGKAEYISRATSKDADLEVRTTIEYDGMVKVDFTIIPKGCIELTDFSYRIHYPEKKAMFLRYDGAKSSHESGNLPKHSYSRSVPKGKRGTVWKAPFKTLVWMGDYEKGFLWFCASEKNWSPQDREKRPEGLRIRRARGSVILEISPVSEPYTFSRPATYTFGMFATPVRPLTKGWRGWTQTYSNFDKGRILYHPNHAWAVSAFYPRIRNFAKYKSFIAEKYREGKHVMPYIDAVLMSLGVLRDPDKSIPHSWQLPDLNLEQGGVSKDSDFAWQPPEIKYYEQWRLEPPAVLAYGKEKGYRQFGVAIASGWSDFLCYLIEQQAKAGALGLADLDEWNPGFDMNPRHGMGYVDQNGVRRGEYDLFAKRDLMKRICAIFLKQNGRPPMIVVHGAATLCMPFMSLFDAILTGENLNSGYFAKRRYLGEYFQGADEFYECLKRGGENYYYYVAPLDRWRTECLGKQFGFAVMFISNLRKDRSIDKKIAHSEKATRDFMAMVVVHDNLTWPVFCDRKPIYDYWQVREEFGIADESVEFYPYWGKKPVAESPGKNVYISAYRNRGTWLVNISNLGLSDVNAQVKLNPGVFGKKKITRAIDAVSKKNIATQGNTFAVSLKARDYKMLFVE